MAADLRSDLWAALRSPLMPLLPCYRPWSAMARFRGATLAQPPKPPWFGRVRIHRRDDGGAGVRLRKNRTD